MAAQGYIPENIVFVFSDSIKAKDINVVPAFPVDAANKKRLESADRWATNGNWQNRGKEKTVKKKEYPNGPFVDVRINDLEFRGEGGRAYKVVVGDDYYVDFREDELMWVIKNRGIREGGFMNGEFCFAVVGSQTKLVPIGSPLWEGVRASGARRVAKEIAASDFVVGHTYERKNQSRFTIIAEVNVPSITLVKKDVSWCVTPVSQRVRLEKVGRVSKTFLIFDSFYSDGGPKADLLKGYVWEFKFAKKPSAIVDLGAVPASDMVTIDEVKKKAQEQLGKSNYVNDVSKELLGLICMQDASVTYVPDPAFVDGAVVWSKK